jgi:hypothetical protein
MGVSVTVDSDDIEILLNAAAAIRHIEDALNAVRQDPAMVRIYKSGKIGEALDRVNRARGDAIKPAHMRAEPPAGWSPTQEEYERLYRLAIAGPRGLATSEVAAYTVLRTYGLCMAGQVNVYVSWADKTQEMIGPDGTQRFRITPLGQEAVKKFARKAPALTPRSQEISHDQTR